MPRSLQGYGHDNWGTVKDFDAEPVAVSTLAQIYPEGGGWAEIGDEARDLQFVCDVPGDNPAAFLIETSEGGTRPNHDEVPLLVEVPAGRERLRRFDDIAELKWRVSAYSSDPGNPATAVNLKILRRKRR